MLHWLPVLDAQIHGDDAVIGIQAGRVGQADGLTHQGRRQSLGHTPGFGRQGDAAFLVLNAQQHMLAAVSQKGALLDQQGRRGEYRFGIAGPKGCRSSSSFKKHCSPARAKSSSHSKVRVGRSGSGPSASAATASKALAEFFQALRLQAHSGGQAVPAEAQQAGGRGREARMQVEFAHRAARALEVALILTENDGGAVKFIHNA